MLEKHRLLPACMLLSVMLHAALLLLPSVRISSGANSPDASRATLLSVRVLSQAQVGQIPLNSEVSKPNTLSEVTPYTDVSVTEPVSGVRGDDENHPVLVYSVEDYLPPSRLEKLPRPIGEVNVSVSFKGLGMVVGEAEIILLISSEGEVDDVLVATSSLPGNIVEDAVERFKKIGFEPGEVGGMKVRSRLRIKLEPPSRDELLGNPYSSKQKAWRR